MVAERMQDAVAAHVHAGGNVCVCVWDNVRRRMSQRENIAKAYQHVGVGARKAGDDDGVRHESAAE